MLDIWILGQDIQSYIVTAEQTCDRHEAFKVEIEAGHYCSTDHNIFI